MRTLYALGAMLLLTSALSCAETFSGQLFDASCADQHKNDQNYQACVPGTQTASFTVLVSGRMLKLDATGNQKAIEAWQDYNSSADRAKDPNMQTSPVTAVVQGTLNGDEIKVESIKLR